jgi:MFS family permease
MLLAAVVLGVVATGAVPAALLLPVFVLIGFALGSTGPSRDLIVRAATPKGAAGRVYGFVYSGLDLGGIIGPVAFGFLLDHGHPREMLMGVAACYLVAIGTVIRVGRASSRRTALARQVA